MILSPFCHGHTLKLKKIKSANFGGINGGWDAAWPHADAIQRAAPAGRHDRPSDAAADRPLPTPRHQGRSPTPPARPTHAITADRRAHPLPIALRLAYRSRPLASPARPTPDPLAWPSPHPPVLPSPPPPTRPMSPTRWTSAAPPARPTPPPVAQPSPPHPLARPQPQSRHTPTTCGGQLSWPARGTFTCASRWLPFLFKKKMS